MSYYLVRLYSGSGSDSAENVLRGAVTNELVPRLRKAGGLIRYIAGITSDGIASASTYQDRNSAHRGLEAAKEFAAESTAMRGYTLKQSVEGEIIAILNEDAEYQPAFGMARLFTTSTPPQTVLESIKTARASAQDQGASKVRTAIVQLQDGRIGTFTAYPSEEARDQHSAAIQKHRSEQSNIFPNQPEEIPVRIITSIAG